MDQGHRQINERETSVIKDEVEDEKKRACGSRGEAGSRSQVNGGVVVGLIFGEPWRAAQACIQANGSSGRVRSIQARLL